MRRLAVWSLPLVALPVLAVLACEHEDGGRRMEAAQGASLAVQDWQQKIRFDLTQLNADGLRGPPDGLRSLAYEFCVPAEDDLVGEVRTLDPTLNVYRESPGRIDCTDRQHLAIGSTQQPNWRSVLEQLARLPYVERIEEFVGE